MTLVATQPCAISGWSWQKHRSKLLKELAARLDRDEHLRYAEQELEMQRLTMAGKGSH